MLSSSKSVRLMRNAKNWHMYRTVLQKTTTTTSAEAEPAPYQVTGQAVAPDPGIINATRESLRLKQKLEELKITHDIPDTQPIPFDEVPGPVVLRFIARMWSKIPIFSNQLTSNTLQYILSAGKIFGSQLSWGNNLNLFRYLLNEYGPVIRLHGPFGGDVVILSRPEHANIVFTNEGSYPIRSSLDCVERYRLHHRMYRQAGPFVMHGPEWQALRKIIEPALKTSLDNQYNRIANTSDDFLIRIRTIRNKQLEVPKNFKDELTKWSLECLCSIMFNKKLGFLDPLGLSSTSETAILLESLNNATKAIRKCEFGFHLWKFFETPAWKKLVENCDTIDHILSNYVQKAQESLKNRNQSSESTSDLSMIEYFILEDKMIAEDVQTVLLDMMILGVNMTAHTAGFLMYHLARYPRAQHVLYQEILKLPDKVSKNDLKNMPYMKACLYESLRLKPPMPVLNRILTKDIVVHGYEVPKGTFVLMATNLSSLREEHFEDALRFKPERWLGEEVNKDVQALATIPFGQGPKSCFAKAVAEVQLYYLMIKILKKYRIEYHYGDIDSNNRLLASPSRPLKFRFVERT